MYMIKIFKTIFTQQLDARNYYELNMIDLSKAYDCLPHDLLVAKCETYVFDNTSLVVITDCLINHLQPVQIGSLFNSYLILNFSEMFFKDQQLNQSRILFTLFINDLMFSFKKTEVCNLADDTTLYYDIQSCSLNYEEAQRKSSYCIIIHTMDSYIPMYIHIVLT